MACLQTKIGFLSLSQLITQMIRHDHPEADGTKHALRNLLAYACQKNLSPSIVETFKISPIFFTCGNSLSVEFPMVVPKGQQPA